jgi:uncharacterized protein (DUF4415 family)
MNKAKRHDSPTTGEIVINVTPEEYLAELSAGVPEEQTLTPGQHVFQRGGFRRRHPEFTDTKSVGRKVRISICLDADVLAYFSKKSEDQEAEPYQTRINAILRAVMEHDKRA